MAEKKKRRHYSNEYLKYGFIPSPTNEQLPLCLVCEKTFSNEAMKPSRLRDHLARMHPDKMGTPVSFFQGLKSKFEKRNTVGKLFGKAALDAEKGLLASYKVSLLIAKCGKSHTLGETLVLPAVKEIVGTLLGPDACAMMKSIPLSKDDVSGRIDEMACDVEETLFDVLKNTEFVLQIDESTVGDNEALLLAYVRFINRNDEIVEELLFARNVTTDTKGSSIYKRVEEFFKEKNIPLANVLACAIDGDASMVGRYRGFIAHLKSAKPDVMAIHCVIHRQHLVAKNLSKRLHESLSYVIKAVNKIKVHSLNNRLFHMLCQENDEEFEHLLLHTEVRWLSKGKCLRRFYELFDTVVECLRSLDTSLCDAIEQRRLDVAYLADIFDKLNEVNPKLQGDKMNFVKAKGIISSFIAKLDFHTNNLSRRELSHFQSLQEIVSKNGGQLADANLDIFCSHLKQVKEDMQTRFHDLCTLETPTWVLNPFSVDAGEFHHRLQEQLIDLKHDIEAQSLFQQCGYECFWLKVKDSYPLLWQKIRLLILAFPSTYLVERGFSVVQELLTKARNNLQICERDDLRLWLTKMEPDIVKLASAHQAQGSH